MGPKGYLAPIGPRLEALSMPEPNSGCRLWLSKLTRKGYGELSIGYVNGTQKRRTAHRLAWIEAYGPIPGGLFVLHKCDTPCCINVDHLFLGTHADNMADMVAKGRVRPWNGLRAIHGRDVGPTERTAT